MEMYILFSLLKMVWSTQMKQTTVQMVHLHWGPQLGDQVTDATV